MAERSELHTRNKHNGQYDFSLLTENYPPLRKFVLLNPLGIQTIDFFNPHAVKALNKALLISYYGIRYWDIPRNYLCPPIPGRADYVHYIADLIDLERVSNTANEENGDKPKRQCRCLDIGVGANCIYPIIGHVEYGWMFVGSDIDPVSIENARKIVTCNTVLAHKIGELRFVLNMISESRKYRKNCGWFTSLVSKEKNLDKLYAKLKAVHVSEYKIIRMCQGTKNSRILAWRFLE